MTRDSLRGVLPVLSTPFRSDWSIDEEALTTEIDWLYGLGVHGVVAAMVSEILRLRFEERKLLGELVVAQSRGRGASILSVGAESTDQAVELADHALALGATAIMANPPLTTSAGPAALHDYFREIAGASGSIPMIVQDASGYVGSAIPLDVLVALVAELGPDKVQFKPEAQPLGPRQSELMTATGGAARVFEGSGGLALVDSHARGAVGTMPGADLAWAIVALWNALERHDSDTADDISSRLAAVLSHVSVLDSYICIEKHLLVHQGVLPHPRARGPVAYRLDDRTAGEIDRLVDKLAAAAGHPWKVGITT